ncbi:hypothetical protein Tco_0503401 [Tanacetum coccineum]
MRRESHKGFGPWLLQYLIKDMGVQEFVLTDRINVMEGLRGKCLGKKSKSTSFNTSESVHFVQETRPVGVDKAKKKAASSFVPSASSDEPLVDMSPEKWTKSETSFLDRKNGEWDVFLELKKQEIELKKREIALREKEFEFLQDKQCQKDELFYTTPHDHLRGKQLEIVLEIKEKIKAKYNSDD